MGIPSYFSHIVRSHRSIIKKYNPLVTKMDNLYLDCNSIIYDSVREITDINNSAAFEKRLIEAVNKKIVYYINLIKPRRRVFIAFDGVAPVAKLDQQRNRRYKSWFEKHICESVDGSQKSSTFQWNTVSITPGTEFMDKLGRGVHQFFRNKKKFGLEELIVSPSDEAGEGEHKIYEYIRDNAVYHESSSTAIYGLDADLIMLTLNHLHISSRLYLFRETPHFIKSIDRTLDPNTNYLMDIPELAIKLVEDFRSDLKNNNGACSPHEQKRVIFDYILLCFFLGNDFMPHFPALNIRTDGIARLIGTYKDVLMSKKEYLTDGKNIIWKNLRKFIGALSENEHSYITTEYAKRRKLRPRYNKDKEEDRVFNALMDVPIKDRGCEEYINPFEGGWRERYYKELFGIDIDDTRCKEICKNYLEGLEWTMNYYTTGCKDWRWTYKYEYPPLLVDLAKYIPYFDVELLEKRDKNPVKDWVQLSYVVPRPYLGLLPKGLDKRLLEAHDGWYATDCAIKWSFCRYFWESHVILPDIDIDKLEML